MLFGNIFNFVLGKVLGSFFNCVFGVVPGGFFSCVLRLVGGCCVWGVSYRLRGKGFSCLHNNIGCWWGRGNIWWFECS